MVKFRGKSKGIIREWNIRELRSEGESVFMSRSGLPLSAKALSVKRFFIDRLDVLIISSFSPHSRTGYLFKWGNFNPLTLLQLIRRNIGVEDQAIQNYKWPIMCEATLEVLSQKCIKVHKLSRRCLWEGFWQKVIHEEIVLKRETKGSRGSNIIMRSSPVESGAVHIN